MIARTISNKLLELFNNFPIVTLTGPRQTGKSTLVQALFPGLPYVNLEEFKNFEFATDDPVSFMNKYRQGAIFDEVQRVPKLFSAIQVEVDKQKRNSMFVLSDSQNFLLLEKIRQSLAGRTAILHLLPFSILELNSTKQLMTLEDHIFSGGYPRIHAQGAPAKDWLSAYIQTYVERDVRSLKSISDLPTFQRFMRACAARIGNIIDYSGIANDLGVTHNTIRSWVDILEVSFITYRLQPHYKNFNKRLIKSPKLYFYDTGLACSLLGITNAQELEVHAMRGSLFECFVLSEMKKYYFNQGARDPLYFWRDRKAEIDCLLEPSLDKLIPIEIKSSRTISPDQFQSLRYWLDLSNEDLGYLIYAGDEQQNRKKVEIWPWSEVDQLLDKLNTN